MWIKILKFLLLFTVFLVPLIPASFGFGFELIKVLIFLLLTIAAGFIFAYLLSKKIVKIHNSKIKIAGLVFLILLTLTSVFGIHPFESLVGKHPYYQGLILYWFLYLFFLMVSELNIQEKKLASVVVYSASIVSIFSIIQFIVLNFFKIEIPSYAGRVVSTFGQPNLYSGFLLLSLPFTLKLSYGKYFWGFIISTGLILSLSRVGIFLLLCFFLYLMLRRIKEKGLLIFLTIFLILNSLIFSIEKSTGLFWKEIALPLLFPEQGGLVVEKRVYFIPIILEIYSGSPFLGYGVDSINSLYKAHYSDFKPEIKIYEPLYFNLMNLNIDRSHNYFLDLLVFSGGLGLGAYILLLIVLFKQKIPSSLTTFLILYLIWVQFQVQSIVHLLLFWTVLGLVDNKNNLIQNVNNAKK